MDLTCPSCQSALALEDVNVTTDLALCRACGKSFQYSELAGGSSADVDLMSPPAGAWFEQLPDGFRTGATSCIRLIVDRRSTLFRV
jgi:transcription elongation factor Elf1